MFLRRGLPFLNIWHALVTEQIDLLISKDFSEHSKSVIFWLRTCVCNKRLAVGLCRTCAEYEGGKVRSGARAVWVPPPPPDAHAIPLSRGVAFLLCAALRAWAREHQGHGPQCSECPSPESQFLGVVLPFFRVISYNEVLDLDLRVICLTFISFSII